MAYDDGMAAQLRNDLGDLDGLREVKMFGGLCFMWRGNMLCGAHGQNGGGGLMRVGKDWHARALSLPGVRPMAMTGRSMTGFVDLDETAMGDDTVRAAALAMAKEFVGALPAK